MGGGGASGQARYDKWEVRGGVHFRPNTKSGGPLLGIGPTLFKYVFSRYNFGRGA